MKAMIESLEGRRLLAGHPGGPFGGGGAIADRLLTAAAGVNDPAVQADVTAVQADKTAIAAAAADVKDQSSDTRQALQDTVQAGLAQLLADRQAIKDAKDDPTALAAAKDKLKADRDQLRTDIQAGRDAVRSDAADARIALQTAMQSLRDHLAQLRTDLQNAGVSLPTHPTPPPGAGQGATGGNQNTTGGTVSTPPAGDGTSTGGTPSDGGTTPQQPTPPPPPGPKPGSGDENITVTPDQAAAVVDKVKQAAAGISGIDQTAVTALTDHLTAAASDSTITPDELKQLGEDVHTVVENLAPADAKAVAGAVVELLHLPPPPPPADVSIPVTTDQAKAVVDKINSIAANISGINQGAVDKLTGDITAAASDGKITSDELTQLHGDVKALVAGLTDADAHSIGDQVRSLLGEPPPPPNGGTGSGTGPGTIPLTADQAKAIVDQIKTATAGISGIDQTKVNALTDALTAAASDGQLSQDEVHQILDDLKAVLQGLDPTAAHSIASTLHDVLPPLPPPPNGTGPGAPPPPPTDGSMPGGTGAPAGPAPVVGMMPRLG